MGLAVEIPDANTYKLLQQATTKALVSATARRMRGFYILFTSTTTPLYLQFFDKATAPVAGDIPLFEIKFTSAAASLFLPSWIIKLTHGLGWAFSTTPDVFTDGVTVTTPSASVPAIVQIFWSA